MQAFSRFYFVGDEDLLEIVGNANEPAKVAQHLGKMFASVGALNMPTGLSLAPSLPPSLPPSVLSLWGPGYVDTQVLCPGHIRSGNGFWLSVNDHRSLTQQWC